MEIADITNDATDQAKADAKAAAIARVEQAIAAANNPKLSRRERREAARALAKHLRAPFSRIIVPLVEHGGFTAVAAQIEHHRRKAGLVEPTTSV